MPKVNLLYIVEGGRPGGAEQNSLSILPKIDKKRYEIGICLLRPSDILEEELKTLGISFFILNETGKPNIFSIFRLTRFMRREKIDIAHTCLYASNKIGRIAARLARVPIIIAWEHGEVFTDPAQHHRINRLLSKYTDVIIACSEAAKEELIKKGGIPPHKIRVIYNCVDLEKFVISPDTQKIRREFGINPDDILIGNVSSLANEVKGQEYLIRAMPQLIKVKPSTRLLLAGEGPSRSYFEQIVEKMGIKDIIIFAGFRRDIPEIMSALDLYVNPSIYEALPISIIEAMSLRKVVVATDVGGVSEVVVEGKTGYLIPPKDSDRLAQTVIDILNNREKMRSMGDAGYERVKSLFSSALITKEIESLYEELIWKIHPRSQ